MYVLRHGQKETVLHVSSAYTDSILYDAVNHCTVREAGIVCDTTNSYMHVSQHPCIRCVQAPSTMRTHKITAYKSTTNIPVI